MRPPGAQVKPFSADSKFAFRPSFSTRGASTSTSTATSQSRTPATRRRPAFEEQTRAAAYFFSLPVITSPSRAREPSACFFMYSR